MAQKLTVAVEVVLTCPKKHDHFKIKGFPFPPL